MTTPLRRSKRRQHESISPDASLSCSRHISPIEVTPNLQQSSHLSSSSSFLSSAPTTSPYFANNNGKNNNNNNKRTKAGEQPHDSPSIIRPDNVGSASPSPLSSSSSSSLLFMATLKSNRKCKRNVPIVPSITKPANRQCRRRPTPDECAYVVQELGKLHPNVIEETKKEKMQSSSCGIQQDILDGVISTMLSQNTTNANSTRAFANLKRTFPTWDDIAKLSSSSSTKLEEAIHCGGLAKVKAQRIMTLCQTLQQENNDDGVVSLEYLRHCSNETIQRELIRFPGLGKKTISCVLLFTLGRHEFPVDTHVYRIAKQHKWIPSNYSRDDAYDYLNAIVPDSLKRNLHCLLIQHGRECHRCAARGKPQFPPTNGTKLQCPLVNLPKDGV